MGDQYRVDLSALEETVKKLNGVMRDMGSANTCAKYQTALSPRALGTDANGVTFQEAHELTGAHETVKRHIEEIVEHLNEVISDFGGKTKKTRDTYQNQEEDVTGAMGGGA